MAALQGKRSGNPDRLPGVPGEAGQRETQPPPRQPAQVSSRIRAVPAPPPPRLPAAPHSGLGCGRGLGPGTPGLGWGRGRFGDCWAAPAGCAGAPGGRRPGRGARRAREPQVVPGWPFSSPFPFSRRPPSRPCRRHFPRFLLPLQSGGREGAAALSCLANFSGTHRGRPGIGSGNFLGRAAPGRSPGGRAGRRAPPGWGLRAVPAPPRLPASSPRQLPRDSPLCWMRTRAHRPRGPA